MFLGTDVPPAGPPGSAGFFSWNWLKESQGGNDSTVAGTQIRCVYFEIGDGKIPYGKSCIDKEVALRLVTVCPTIKIIPKTKTYDEKLLPGIR